MYTPDERDRVTALEHVPQSSVGAPLPLVLADEHRLLLAYLGEQPPETDGGRIIHVIGPTTPGETVALVELRGCRAYMHGPPNDEAFEGHPLADRGLQPYGAFEVRESALSELVGRILVPILNWRERRRANRERSDGGT